MTLLELVKEYIHKRKGLFTSYVIICCIVYIVKVLVTSSVYSELFDKNTDIPKTFKKICGVWITLCILYVVRSRIDTMIVPDFLTFIRKSLFANYIRNNGVNFNDTNVTVDVTKILEVSKHISGVFQWIFSTFIPTFILMICINGYFLIKYPTIGVINTIGNIANAAVILSKAPGLFQSSNKRENKFIYMTGKLEENFNNLLNIYLNDKADDTIIENNILENEYINVYKDQNRELEKFIATVKVNTYTFAFISMYMLYKQSTDRATLISGLLIFTFYLGTLENMSEDIPLALMTLGNIKNIENSLAEKDPNHVRVHPIYQTDQIYQTLSNVKGSIDFNNIWFRYNKDDEKYVLKNFSLHIKPGEKIGFVAQSGFGKTTSMKLLLGFYKPEKGTILLDGININDIQPHQLRTYINYVNQKTLLFHDTIINNMKYGNTKTTSNIIDFLNKYNLLTIFCNGNGSVEDCLNNVVEKNGTNISMGMQKIIFLVRGILKDNTSVYIFDEPLTSIDPSTRKNVLNMIKTETTGRTTLIITHDKEVNDIVDRIINLSDLNSS